MTTSLTQASIAACISVGVGLIFGSTFTDASQQGLFLAECLTVIFSSRCFRIVAQAAAEQEDGGDDIIDTVWNYSTATLAGIGAGIVGGLILIGCLLYAYCRSRNAKRAYQLNSAQV